MRALGCDIFAGGFTLGVRKHFDIVAHLEESDYGVASVRRNLRELPVFHPIDRWPVTEIARTGPIDFIYGNPPCAAWSPLGRIIQAGAADGDEQWSSDLRVSCTRVHFNLLRYFEPTVWAWESVPQAYTRGRSFVDELTRSAWDLGYDVSYVLHNAMYISGLQHRKRFFMVAHKVSIPWETSKFREPIPAGEALRRYLAPKKIDAIDTNLPLAFLKSIEPGTTLRDAREKYIAAGRTAKSQGDRAKSVPGFGFALGRLHPDKVSRAVVGAMLVHPTEPRFLNVQELKFLSGIPVGYKLSGKPPAQAAEIARGVNPPVGAWLAKLVREGIERGRSVSLTGDRRRAWEVNLFQPPGQILEVTDEVS